MLGFIRRMSSPFKNSSTFYSLYFTLVRSHLEFASICWSPHYTIYINRIEKIQNKFIKFCNYKFPNNNNRLMSLENRRTLLDMTFLYKIINNKTDCPQLISCLCFRVTPYSTRNNELFFLPFNRTNFAFNSPVNRMCLTYNKLSAFESFPDIFFVSLTTFKKCIATLL